MMIPTRSDILYFGTEFDLCLLQFNMIPGLWLAESVFWIRLFKLLLMSVLCNSLSVNTLQKYVSLLEFKTGSFLFWMIKRQSKHHQIKRLISWLLPFLPDVWLFNFSWWICAIFVTFNDEMAISSQFTFPSPPNLKKGVLASNWSKVNTWTKYLLWLAGSTSIMMFIVYPG